MDLDNLLDDVDISTLKPTGATTTATKPRTEIDIDKGLKLKVLSSEIKPWLASSANVPKEFREKWTKMVKADVECELCSKFQPSYAYRNLDSQSTVIPKNGLLKALQNLIKTSAVSSKISDAKLTKIMNLVNPLTDSENGKRIQESFGKYLIKELKDDILNDPNYEKTKFPELAALIES